MKFGEHLKSKIHEPWRSYYLDYNKMKLEMKQKQQSSNWTSQDDTRFFKKIQSELIKVYQFSQKQLDSLNRRALQQQDVLLKQKANRQPNYEAIADQLTEILFDTNDLSAYHQLNRTGFQKLIKKHDKHSPTRLATPFRHFSTQWSLEQQAMAFDVLIVKLSDLHDLCQRRGLPRHAAQNQDQTQFERATAKYWIHPDHITEVKSIILFHLPVHVFHQEKPYEAQDMAVSSVYYDNDRFDLYHERLDRREGAEAIRFRWYGPHTPRQDVYVERKTHKASWLEGKSVKDRFRLREDQVQSFVDRNLTTFATPETQFIASGVQRSLAERKLKPTCRVFYHRTAFQLPGDQRLRISLDCNLTFIRERAQGSAWRQHSLGTDYPFSQVDESDISRFPYAILETKLQTHLGQEAPGWLTTLIESHLVHEVPRFSKYIHGAAMLFRRQVPLMPYWLPTFDLDIRKKVVANVGLSRSMSLKPLVNGHHRQSLYQHSKSVGDFSHIAIEFTGQQTTKQEIRKKELIGRAVDSLPVLNSQKPKKLQEVPSQSNLKRSQDLSKKVKIEPKTFFANERTFISWLQFCALLLTVALSLLNNGDRISRIIGAVFIILSSLMAFYALIRYQIRTKQLKNLNSQARYDDVWGPTVLCILLVTALIVNFYLRLDTFSESYYEQEVEYVTTTVLN